MNYYHNLSDVIPNTIYLATGRNETSITSENIKKFAEIM